MGAAQHGGSILASHPAAPGSIPSITKKNFRGNIINVAEINQWHWLEESEQWLENVDRVLASGKPVLKNTKKTIFLDQALLA